MQFPKAIKKFFLGSQLFEILPLVQCGREGQPICTLEDFWGVDGLVDRLIQFGIFYIAIPVGVALIIYGGILMATSGGNTSRVQQGKTVIKSVVIGLVMAFGAFLLVRTIMRLLFK